MTSPSLPSSPSIFAFVPCYSIEEIEVAGRALASFRAGNGASAEDAPADLPAAELKEALADRLEDALNAVPLNPQRRLLLQLLLAHQPATWLAYDLIKTRFASAGLAESQASAALRDLSWQMKTFLPTSDTVGLDASISVLAERSRVAGVVNYRLTPAGRTAVERYLA